MGLAVISLILMFLDTGHQMIYINIIYTLFTVSFLGFGIYFLVNKKYIYSTFIS